MKQNERTNERTNMTRPGLHGALQELRALETECARELDTLRNSIAVIARICGQDGAVSPNSQQPPDSKATIDQAPAPKATSRVPRETKPAVQPESPVRPAPPTGDLTARVLAYFNACKEPAQRIAVQKALKQPMHRVSPVIDGLVAAGTIVKTGRIRGVRLGLPSVMAQGSTDNEPQASAPTRRGRTPDTTPAARTTGQVHSLDEDPFFVPEAGKEHLPRVASKPRATTSNKPLASADQATTEASSRATAQVYIAHIRAIVSDGQRHNTAALKAALRVKLGRDVSLSHLYAALDALTSERTLKLFELAPPAGRAYALYTEDERAAMPQARSIPVDQVLDPHAVAQRLEQILSSGASYDLAELHRNMRSTFPTITRDQVTPVLDRFVLQHRLRLIPLGSTSRYQLLPRQAASA